MSVTGHRPVPIYTAWWQRHMGVNYLPKVVTQQRFGRGSKLWPLSHQFDTLASRLPSHPKIMLYKINYSAPLLHQNFELHCLMNACDVIPVTTTRSMGQLFESRAVVEPSDCVLDGSPDPHRKGQFWLLFCHWKKSLRRVNWSAVQKRENTNICAVHNPLGLCSRPYENFTEM